MILEKNIKERYNKDNNILSKLDSNLDRLKKSASKEKRIVSINSPFSNPKIF